jgi:hypothetical protein
MTTTWDNTSTEPSTWTGYVTFTSGDTRPANIEAGAVYYDKARTPKMNWLGYHRAPAKLAATYRPLTAAL